MEKYPFALAMLLRPLFSLVILGLIVKPLAWVILRNVPIKWRMRLSRRLN